MTWAQLGRWRPSSDSQIRNFEKFWVFYTFHRCCRKRSSACLAGLQAYKVLGRPSGTQNLDFCVHEGRWRTDIFLPASLPPLPRLLSKQGRSKSASVSVEVDFGLDGGGGSLKMAISLILCTFLLHVARRDDRAILGMHEFSLT